MHIHEEVLEAANRLVSHRSGSTFRVEEVVRSLTHLNESSVRTHIVSRCCVNAPKNHLHKWDYFRRVGRGEYKIEPRYRQSGVKGTSQGATHDDDEGQRSRPQLRSTIHAVIHHDAPVYVAECLEVAVVTQGETLDELMKNLMQAVSLHLEGEDMASMGLTGNPRIQILYDAPLAL